MQWKTKQQAIRELKKISNKRAYSIENEMIAPAAVELITKYLHLLAMSPHRKSLSGKNLKKYRSILRGLELYPIPEWAPKYILVMARMTGAQTESINDLMVRFYQKAINMPATPRD